MYSVSLFWKRELRIHFQKKANSYDKQERKNTLMKEKLTKKICVTLLYLYHYVLHLLIDLFIHSFIYLFIHQRIPILILFLSLFT